MPIRLVARVLSAALALGVLGDWLLRSEGPWGLNLFGGIAALTVVAMLLLHLERPPAPPAVLLLLLLPPLVAFGLVWRDAPALRAWNVVALVSVLSLPVLRLGGVRLSLARLADYVTALGVTGVRTLVGPLHFASSKVPWHEALHGPQRRRAMSVLVGLLLTVPLLVVFSALFASADAGFERALETVFFLDLDSVVSHGLGTALVAWLSAGYLMAILSDVSVTSAWWDEPRLPSLGALELGIPLGALTLLFATFVVMQAGYVFGGQELVLSSEGLGYAEYARRGFFELVTVAVLVLPVLLAADLLTDRADPAAHKVVRGLSVVLLVPVALIMMSALHRMDLYMDAYGLTQSRVYATGVLVWAGGAIAWLGVTVLRSRAQRFAFGAMVGALGVLGSLNVLNPDALVVRVNLSRAEAGAELDVSYLLSLSADAVPSLMSALSSGGVPLAFSSSDVCSLMEELEGRWGEEDPPDWRSWNVGRARARRAVATAPPCDVAGQPAL